MPYQPAHYIVFHPDRQRIHAHVRANAILSDSGVVPWEGKVWLDCPPDNEDPFVLGDTWAYSYCHATQLRREPRATEAFVTEGSCILFCSGQRADANGDLAIDTVFWIRRAHRWPTKDQPPPELAGEAAKLSDLWQYHLRFGGTGGHDGVFTYEGVLYAPAIGSNFSHLPLGADGDRVRIPIEGLSIALRDAIKGNLHGKFPLRLSGPQLEELLHELHQQTATKVIQPITVDDVRFAAERAKDGGLTCANCGAGGQGLTGQGC